MLACDDLVGLRQRPGAAGKLLCRTLSFAYHGVGLRAPVPGPSPSCRKAISQKLAGTTGSPTITFSGKMKANCGARHVPAKRPFAAGARVKQGPVVAVFLPSGPISGAVALMFAGSGSWNASRPRLMKRREPGKRRRGR